MNSINASVLVMMHGFLYYTQTDFMPFADSQNKAKN